MIRIQNLTKTFIDSQRNEFRAVDDISLQIGTGEVFGLLGPNGAGKSTLLRMLATLLSPTAGTATLNGFDLRKNPDGIKRSIGFLSGNTRLYGRLTPRELLRYFGELYEMPLEKIDQRSEQIFALLNMNEFIDQRIEKLSTGQTQKTSIARCILHDPEIFIFDEPTLGLDILTSRNIIEFIRDASVRGKTVIVSTHYMEEAEMLSHRIGLLYQGRLLDVDNLKQLRQKTGKAHLADIFLSYIEGGMRQAA